MLRCSHCACFVPITHTHCPECRTAVSAMRQALLRSTQLVMGATTAVTLMACYGDVYDYDCIDQDYDGVCREYDCDDQDGRRYPGNVDTPGDGLDANCDGVDGVAGTDAGPDAPMSIDAGYYLDAGPQDAEPADGGGPQDAAPSDAEPSDAAMPMDAEPSSDAAAPMDAAPMDAAPMDAAPMPDAG